jgi:Holliday junction resolvase-like predicted endonuclease
MNHENANIGRAYEDHVEQYLAARGYEPIGRNVRHQSGAELDLHMRHRSTGQQIGVECKASRPDCNGAPGLQRSDNVWKVLGYLHAIRMWIEDTGGALDYIVATSNAPVPGTKWHDLIERARLRKEFDVIEIPWNGNE